MKLIKFRPIYTVAAVALVALVYLAFIFNSWESPGQQLMAPSTINEEYLELTGTTARLVGEDHIQTAIAYSQAVYAAAQDEDRPGAVILVRDDEPAVALATTRLMHFPVNAPILYVTNEGQSLPEATKEEIERLGPEGVMLDNNVQVYVCGDISPKIVKELQESGHKTRVLYAPNVTRYVEVLDEYIAILENNHRDIVFVASLDALEYAFPAGNWNSHAGDVLAYVTNQGVPEETIRLLQRRGPYYPYIYIFAPPSVLGEAVASELSKYGYVQRIPGDSPQEMAVRWAGYKDTGHLEGWWVGFRSRSTGWGIAESGHNAILANPSDWQTIVPSGVLSHMGKHAFLLLTQPDGTLPDVAQTYLKVIKPTLRHPSTQVYNFGWIVGTDIPENTAQNFSALLSYQD